MSRYGWIRRSLMDLQMIRVISSPSISTTGPTTVIFANARLPGVLVCGIATRRRGVRRGPDTPEMLRPKGYSTSRDPTAPWTPVAVSHGDGWHDAARRRTRVHSDRRRECHGKHQL